MEERTGVEEKVTVVMTSFRNHDFTLAAVWAILKYYPDIQVIISDGSDTFQYEGRLFFHIWSSQWS